MLETPDKPRCVAVQSRIVAIHCRDTTLGTVQGSADPTLRYPAAPRKNPTMGKTLPPDTHSLPAPVPTNKETKHHKHCCRSAADILMALADCRKRDGSDTGARHTKDTKTPNCLKSTPPPTPRTPHSPLLCEP